VRSWGKCRSCHIGARLQQIRLYEQESSRSKDIHLKPEKVNVFIK